MMERMLSALQEKVRQALRWSERYTKTDMVYLAGNGFWLAAGQVTIGLTALGLSSAFAHFVPKDVYGNYRFLLSVFWILTAFSLTGVSVALTRAVARGDRGAYSAAIRLSLIWGIPMLLIGFGTSIYYFVNANAMLGWGCLVIALIGPLMQSAYLYGSFLEGKRAFRENAVAGITLNLVPALGIFACMFIVQDPVIFLLLFLGLSVLTGAVISFIVWRWFNTDTKTESAGLASLSGHFSAMNVLNTISQQVDRVLVFHYLGAVDLAVYAFATAIPDQIKVLMNNVATLALPNFVKRTFGETYATLMYRMLGFMALSALVIVAYILIIPPVFELLFPTYLEAVPYSMMYALSLVFVAAIIPITLLEAHAAKRELYIYNAAGPVFQILILFVLVSGYGLLGAVLARIAGRFFYLVLSIVLTGTYAKRATASAQ